MPMLELSFPARAERPLAADHAYPLYAALSRILPALHERADCGVLPLTGRQIGSRLLSLVPWSRLTLRVPDDQIGTFLPLSGEALDVGGATVRLGVPEVQALVPASVLRSRLVTIKLRERVTHEGFQSAVRRQLDALGVSNQATIALPERNGKTAQRTLRIHHREIIGFEVLLGGLTAEESLAVQEQGIGGRRKLGCGLFVRVGNGGSL